MTAESPVLGKLSGIGMQSRARVAEPRRLPTARS
jgi:hypothetical protein